MTTTNVAAKPSLPSELVGRRLAAKGFETAVRVFGRFWPTGSASPRLSPRLIADIGGADAQAEADALAAPLGALADASLRRLDRQPLFSRPRSPLG